MGERNVASWRGCRKTYPAIGDICAPTQRMLFEVNDTNAVAGTNTLTLITMPTETLYLVTLISAFNQNTNPTFVAIRVASGGVTYRLVRKASPGVSNSVELNCWLLLFYPDVVSVQFTGCAAGDTIRAHACGWEIEWNA